MGDYISRDKVIEAIDNITWWKCRNGSMERGAQSSEYAWFKAQDVYAAIENIPGETYPRETWLNRVHKLLPNMDAADVIKALCPDSLFGKEQTNFPQTEGICPSWSDGNCLKCWTSPVPNFDD